MLVEEGYLKTFGGNSCDTKNYVCVNGLAQILVRSHTCDGAGVMVLFACGRFSSLALVFTGLDVAHTMCFTWTNSVGMGPLWLTGDGSYLKK